MERRAPAVRGDFGTVVECNLVEEPDRWPRVPSRTRTILLLLYPPWAGDLIGCVGCREAVDKAGPGCVSAFPRTVPWQPYFCAQQSWRRGAPFHQRSDQGAICASCQRLFGIQ